MKRALVVSALLLVALFSNSHLRGSLLSLISKPEPVEESMHEFMEYVFQPTYKRLKTSIAKEDKDKATWKAIKSDALILAESGNLLLIRIPKEKGEDWSKHTVAVRNLGGQLYQAAKKQNDALAKQAYREMLTNCNECHKQFADGKYQLKP